MLLKAAMNDKFCKDNSGYAIQINHDPPLWHTYNCFESCS